MTKNEFDKYIFSLNKQPGEFTKDEIYELGKIYRDVEGKRWQYLADLVGWESGEKLRLYIKNRLSREGGLESQNMFAKVENRIIDSESDEELNVELDEKLRKIFKEQQKYRDIMTSYRRTLRDEARIELMQDAIKQSTKELATLPKVKYEQSSKINTSEAVLLLSDLHIGVECDNFYNKYNTEIASQRLSKLVSDTIKYCDRNNVKRLNVCNLGDLIHGVIHINARIEQGMDVISQVMTAGELLAEALNLLQKAAPEVIYRSVTDNHSRVVANKGEHLEKENFYRLIDWYLKERLKNSNIIFKDDNIDMGIGMFTLLNSKKIVFVHGHEDSINQAIQNFIGATKEFIDYIAMGHYHCEKVKSFQGARVIVNGSIVGTEQYALSKRLFSKPSQILMIFENNNLNTISIGLED